ncbi:hypothetical protein AB4564_07365 [Vibrio sp. 10N.222.51.E8]|uniref:hypothetical protein n=1 Tax=unclassified Vibrio TaxID=2614977 RepID=UPI000C840261|nr:MULTISPECIES: hypothetical protein [unclassified Vibrio]PML67108.1 hypothetical protein BCT71_19500 [Vibrio sp. 10N.261.51.A7]TKG35031.1 hypothetical protein FCV85_05490 [Vibrio sp. F13]
MNFSDPNLILVKRYRGGKCSHYQVSDVSRTEITIKDIEHGGYFSFAKDQLASHIEKGLLITISKDTLPETVFVNPVGKKIKPQKEKPQKAKRELEYEQAMERRYAYVRGVLDSDVPAYTQKRLDPWLAAFSKSIGDANPPSWRTLAEWVSVYVRSGWQKKALKPAHALKGNRSHYIDDEVEKLLRRVVREYSLRQIRVNYTQAHNDFLKLVEKLNQSRVKQGLKPVKASSYRTTVNRFQL